jgi:hypothetical protein
MDFGRQPLPVKVSFDGHPDDILYWRRELMRRAEFKGDSVEVGPDGRHQFTIYPRAVND